MIPRVSLDLALMLASVGPYEPFSLLLTFLIVGFIVLYSLLLGNIFGHVTFWRLKNLALNISPVWSRTQYYFRSYAQYFRSDCGKHIIRHSSFGRKFSSISQLPEPLLLEILGYLDGFTLMKVATCSVEFRNLANSSAMWTSLFSHTFDKALIIQFIDYLQTIQSQPLLEKQKLFSKRNYFRCLRIYPHFLLTQNPDTINVIVRGYVLYIPHSFVDYEHPGGGDIIHHYHLSDATEIFDISNHSQTALMQMKQFIYWSSNQYGSS